MIFDNIPNSNKTDLRADLPLPWYNITTDPTANNRFGQDYCEYCFDNFHRWYPLQNNVCQSCGRTPKLIKDVNQQASIKLTAINEKTGDDEAFRKGISIDMDYSEILTADESNRRTQNTDSTGRMIARSAGEAIRLINKAEKQSSKYYSPLPNLGFRQKTTADKDRRSPEDTEL